MCLLVMGLNFTACDDDNDEAVNNHVNVTLTFQAPSDIEQYNPVMSLESLELKNVNTGEVITPLGNSRANSGLSVTISVPQGLYDVNMEAQVRYEVDGSTQYTSMRAYKEAVNITEATATTPMSFECYVYNPSSKNGGFVIAEIFFTGTETPEGKQYNGDKYFRIYNNSSETLCADGLAIAESEFMTVSKEAYTPDIMSEAFSAGSIYRIPLGLNRMVAPGESILICDNGIDHTQANKNSFDLTKADFEWYDVSTNPKFEDIDSDVPNLEKIASYTATIWAPHNRGFRSYVLCRLGENFENQLTAEDFLKDNFYEYTYNYIFDGNAIPMDGSAYKIPNTWVLDAVNLSVESEFQWIITSPALDKGWTYCGKVDGDKTRYGKSVRRKVLSGKVLQDTNDSSVDFLPEQKADPYYKFY